MQEGFRSVAQGTIGMVANPKTPWNKIKKLEIIIYTKSLTISNQGSYIDFDMMDSRKKTRTGSSSCLRFFVKFDLAGKEFSFYLPDQNLKYKTSTGGIVCLVFSAIWLTFAINQFIILNDRSDYIILQKKFSNELDHDSFSFSPKDGLAIAAGFISYQDRKQIDPEIGQLKFYVKSWTDPSQAPIFQELKQRKCTKDEIYGNDDVSSYGFFDTFHKDYEKVLRQLLRRENLFCIDENYQVYGEFDSPKAASLMIVFERCDAKKEQKCKSDEEIDNAIKNSYIVIIENEQSYEHQNEPSSGESVHSYKKLSWYALSNQVRQDFVKKINIYDIMESYYRFGFGFSVEKKTIFQSKNDKTRIMPYLNQFQLAITYEIENVKNQFIRREYSFFDFFSSLGGLGSILMVLARLLNLIEMPQIFVTSDLLHTQDEQQNEIELHTKENIQQNCCLNLKIKLAQWNCLPQKCKKCCLGYKEQLLIKAHSDLKQQMSISYLLKQIRTIETFVKQKFQLSESEWKASFDKNGLITPNHYIAADAQQIAKIGFLRNRQAENSQQQIRVRLKGLPPSARSSYNTTSQMTLNNQDQDNLNVTTDIVLQQDTTAYNSNPKPQIMKEVVSQKGQDHHIIVDKEIEMNSRAHHRRRQQ